MSRNIENNRKFYFNNFLKNIKFYTEITFKITFNLCNQLLQA